jgi:DUF2934 family protein
MKAKPNKNSGEGANPPHAPELRQKIEMRAYEIWVAGGRVDGNAVSHWLQAEKDVLREKGPGKPGSSPSGA